MSRQKIDWFRMGVILALAAITFWLIAVISGSKIGWMIPSAKAGEMQGTWSPPIKNCDGSTMTNLAGYKVLWGQAPVPLPATATNYTVTGLTPGVWAFSVLAFNSTGQESQFVTATKTVTAAEFVTKTTAIYTVVKGTDQFLILPLSGSVPLGTPCIASQNVNGKYAVPRSAVTWGGSTKPVVVLADCG